MSFERGTMKNLKSPRSSREAIEVRLELGTVNSEFLRLVQPDSTESAERRLAYSLFSSIKAAIRERADDHNRSTDRSAMSSASDVSAVVKPAK